MSEKKLKGQKIAGWAIIGVGILHTLAHFLIAQPREELIIMLSKGMFNVLGPDWGAVNFSVAMSLAMGFSILFSGILIVQMADRGWQVPLGSAIALFLLYVFIVYAGPAGGGWLALPSCIFLVIKAWPGKNK